MTDSDLDELGYDAVKQRFERGDYIDIVELATVKKWLRSRDKERELLAACERASISSALTAARAARRANLIAFLALVIATIAAREQVIAIASTIFAIFHR